MRELLENNIFELPWLLSPKELKILAEELQLGIDNMDTLPPLLLSQQFREKMLIQLQGNKAAIASIKSSLNKFKIQHTYSNKNSDNQTPIFDYAFFVFGIRRGGNHAIAEWLKGHFLPEEILYVNSADIGHFSYDQHTITIDQIDYTKVKRNKNQKVLLVGYENLEFQEFPFHQNKTIAQQSFQIVVLRDFVNTAASVAKSVRTKPAFAFKYRVKDLVALWSIYAENYLTRHQHIKFINFNNWYSEKTYREKISNELGLEHSDRTLAVVSSYGGGSSFEGMRLNNNVQQMDVLNRWKMMLNDDIFRFILLMHPENLLLNKKIFDNFPYSYDEIQKVFELEKKLSDA